MMIVFFGATAAFVSLGLVAGERLRRVQSRFRYVSLLGVMLLLAGALVWGGLLASPFVRVV